MIDKPDVINCFLLNGQMSLNVGGIGVKGSIFIISDDFYFKNDAG